MKKLAFFVLSVALCAGTLFAQNAASIMQASQDLVKADTLSRRSRMVITARNGSTTERSMDQYSKDSANGYSRAVIVFQNPATVKGTRFLTMDNASGDSDQWIYLPSLGKVRRIASSEGSSSFMGSDFSYDDMSIMDRDVSLDTHTILREETLNGTVCHVIQSIPKDSSFQYSKILSWIDKTNHRMYKRELYNSRGIVEKTMGISGYRNIQGRDTPMQITITTVAAGTSTSIYMDIVKYDDPIPDGVFTTDYLETGRVR